MLLAMTLPDEYQEVFEPPKEHEPPRLSRYSQGVDRAVNFDFIPGSQRIIHERLENWSRSLVKGRVQAVAAGFGMAQSSYARDRNYGAPTSVPVDIKDAQKIAMAIGTMAQDMRNDGFRRAAALNWYYHEKCKGAPGKAKELNFSLHGLADCVIAARYALIERGV